mmetsp:Transcript_23466/g.23433  ORF Transcript_23466/g.23433 Transcript_23466/m.23433 type:complete len:133 (+) Transcript_23466:347-745(+)
MNAVDKDGKDLSIMTAYKILVENLQKQDSDMTYILIPPMSEEDQKSFFDKFGNNAPLALGRKHLKITRRHFRDPENNNTVDVSDIGIPENEEQKPMSQALRILTRITRKKMKKAFNKLYNNMVNGFVNDEEK